MKENLAELVKAIKKSRESGKPEPETFNEFVGQLVVLIQQNVLTARDTVIEFLREATGKNQLIDPRNHNDVNIWRWCWTSFLASPVKDPLSADKVIEECYNWLLKLQERDNERYHKGTPLQTRAEGLSYLGQQAKVKRLVILAYVEDLITGQQIAPAWQTLKAWGIDAKDLNLIEQETSAIRQAYNAKGLELLYPEEVYQRIQHQIEYGSLGELNREIVYTNSIYLGHLLDLVEEASKRGTADEKKRTLENLAQYLFSSIVGWYVQPSTRTGPYELDGIISNSSNHQFLRTLDTYIPIECKNWRVPVGAEVITQFIGKLNLFKCNMGILISRRGIKNKTVNELRKDAYRRGNIYVLVFDRKDIRSIVDGQDLVALLIQKFKELKFSIRI